MSLELVAEVWNSLRAHVDSHSREDAADDLVNLLIDYDYGAPEIKDAFKGDKDISRALKFYADQHDTDEEYEDEDEEDDPDDEY